MSDYRLVQENNPDPQDIKTVDHRLWEFNTDQVGYSDSRRLAIFIRDDNNQILGGIIGFTFWGWLAVDLLWVKDNLRGQGYGRRLLQAAEQEAIARGCKQVLLDTFSFQAPEFYRRQGYEQFGVLDGFAGKHQRLYFRKRLK
jgi:GNAT superfamily N-acetyltransferase